MSERLRKAHQLALQTGDVLASKSVLQQWLKADPKALEPNLILAGSHLTEGHCRLAREKLVASIINCACPADLVLEAMLALSRFAEHDAMVDFARLHRGRAGMTAQMRARIALLLNRIGATELALAWVQDAVKQAPNDVMCRINHASILTHLGRFDAAEKILDALIQAPQTAAMAFWQAARLRKQTLERNLASPLQRQLMRNDWHPEDRAYLNFALFKTHDDLGDYDKAWPALVAANDAIAQLQPYDPKRVENFFHRMQSSSIGKSAMAQLTQSSLGGQFEFTPIFIVGLHRSGTSLVEQWLSAHENVHALGETNRLHALHSHVLDTPVHESLDEAWLCEPPVSASAAAQAFYHQLTNKQSNGAAWITEKSPAHFWHIGWIFYHFPNAKVIHVQREPLDVCFANYRELLGLGSSHAYQLRDLAHYHAHYQAMMAHWMSCFSDRILNMHYESFVAEPEAAIARLFEYCGLSALDPREVLAPNHARAVTTLSAVQVRQPIHQNSVQRWRHYAEHLEPLRAALASVSVDESE